MAAVSRQAIPLATDDRKSAKQDNHTKIFRDLLTAPAWVSAPDLFAADLSQTQAFPVDKKAWPRKRQWCDDWRELVIAASPYSRHVAPVQERPAVSVREAVSRKILKLRAKLGITSADLSPPSASLACRESRYCSRQRPHNGCEGAGDKLSPPTGGQRGQVDVRCWRTETEEMMSLLGSCAKRACEYPTTELKRKMRSSYTSPSLGERERRNTDRPWTSAVAASTAQECESAVIAEDGHHLPVYLHDAPWPRPRPTAEVAARARATRRSRAERGGSTAADARADLEERVSSSLVGVVPEEYCRDAPKYWISHNEGGTQEENEVDSCGKTWTALTPPDSSRSSTPAGISSSGSAIGRPPRKRPRSPPAPPHSLTSPHRQAGPNVADIADSRDDCGRRSAQRYERSRRRLAAFLREHASGAVEKGGRCPEHPSTTISRVGTVGVEGAGITSSGANHGDVSSCPNTAVRAFGVGGDEIASAIPSRSMTAGFVDLLERCLGRGVWADQVASQIARPLDAILAYLPPEGAELHDESGCRFLPSVGSGGGGNSNVDDNSARNQSQIAAEEYIRPVGKGDGASSSAVSAVGHSRPPTSKPTIPTTARQAGSVSFRNDGFSLTGTLERGATVEAPRAVWLGRVAAVMEARGDRDEAVRLYGKASAALLKSELSAAADDIGGCQGIGQVTACEQSAGGGARTRDKVSRGRGLLFPYSARAHHLSSTIERAYRRHFRRRVTAQIRAAAAFRGVLNRAGQRRGRRMKGNAADLIGRAWRRRMLYLHGAAVRIQAAVRGLVGRRRHKKLLLAIACATAVQARARQFLAKKKLRRMRFEGAAATSIQALQKGFAVRSARAAAIADVHAELWRAALGLNRVRRGFLHRSFAAMVRQFALDEEIKRSEAEAALIGPAVSLANTRAEVYLATDAGKADLAREVRRARVATVSAKIRVRHALPAERKRRSALDVFDSFDLDGSGTIDTSELKPLLAALGISLNDAELKVALAGLDADGSGDVSFSKFYDWYNGTSDCCDDDDGMSAITTPSRDQSSGVSKEGMRNGLGRDGSEFGRQARHYGRTGQSGKKPLREAYAKARRGVRAATGLAIQERARRAIIRRWVSVVARETQVRFRETRPPPLECCVCHQAFALYGDYWKHFVRGSSSGGRKEVGVKSELECRKRPRGLGLPFRDHHRLMSVGEELRRIRAVEKEWSRTLDERAQLEEARVRAEAAEEARIMTNKGSTGARELSDLAARLFDARASELASGKFVEQCGEDFSMSQAEAISAQGVARLAFQAFDRDGSGALDVSDLSELLQMLTGVSGDRDVGGLRVRGIEAAMEEMDEDNRGKIDFDEFARWFKRQVNATDAATQDARPIRRCIEVRERNTSGGLSKGRGMNGGGTAGDGFLEEDNEHSSGAGRGGAVCSNIEDSSTQLIILLRKTSSRREIEGSAAAAHRLGSQGDTIAFSLIRGRSAAVSSDTAATPWERHAEMLRAVAGQEAKTLLLRRAGLRARVEEFERFRVERSPERQEWATKEFLEKNCRSNVRKITAKADAFFVENLRQNLRETEDIIERAMTSEHQLLHDSRDPRGITRVALATAPGDRGSLAADPPDDGDEDQDARFAEAVKAAEDSAAAARRRAFQTPVGRAEVARAVRRLEASTSSTSSDSAAMGLASQGRGTLEGSSRAMRLFELFDADGSGAIDREELVPLLRELGISASYRRTREEIFQQLHLDRRFGGGGVGKDEFCAWLDEEGMAFYSTLDSRLLRIRQTARAFASPKRRLEHQAQSSIVARARATARAEAWASLPPTKTSMAAGRVGAAASATATARTTATATRSSSSSVAVSSGKEGADGPLHHYQKKKPSRGVCEDDDSDGAVDGVLGLKRGRGLGMYERAVGRRRRMRVTEEERAAEREVLLNRVEEEAELRTRRRWRTQAGAAELRWEEDRLRGATRALEATLRAWDARAYATDTTVLGPGGAADRKLRWKEKREEEKMRHLFREFDASCDGCIDVEELWRLLARMRVRLSEAELEAVLRKMDGNASGDVDMAEFSAWWREEGLFRISRRPATAIAATTLARVASSVAPATAIRGEARRALLIGARAEARARVKASLRREDEAALIVTGDAGVPRTGDDAIQVPFRSLFNNKTNKTSERHRNSDSAGNLADSGGGSDGCTGGVSFAGWTKSDARRVVAARASKLARAEADAYADVQATLRTPAGKRELARRTAALHRGWNAAFSAAAYHGGDARRHSLATSICVETPAGKLGIAGTAGEASEWTELPLLRLLWGLHSGGWRDVGTTGGAGVSRDSDIEPSELKYVGASLRSIFGTGTKATVTMTTKGRSTTDLIGAEKEEADEVHGLKTLARVGFYEYFEACLDTLPVPAKAAAPKSRDASALADLSKKRVALLRRLRLLFFLKPGLLRDLAEESMLAEGRAFERHELARVIALEDEEPWCVAEKLPAAASTTTAVAVAEPDIDSNGGVLTTGVDRLRETASGVARLVRALAQGEDLVARECRSFLKTAAGRGELAAARLAARECRRRMRPAALDSQRRRDTMVRDRAQGLLGAIKAQGHRIVSASHDTGKEELRCAFALCEVEGLPGEVSRAEAVYVLEYAGIPQEALATVGRVKLSSTSVLRQEKSTEGGDGGGRHRREWEPKKISWWPPTSKLPRFITPSKWWGKQNGRGGSRVCPTDDVDDAEQGGSIEGNASSKSENSEGSWSLDIDVVDDVTSDEGFELGEMEIILDAVLGTLTPSARAARFAHLLSRRALPTALAENRDARMLLMSRARTAGRDKAMHAFENLLTIHVDEDRLKKNETAGEAVTLRSPAGTESGYYYNGVGSTEFSRFGTISEGDETNTPPTRTSERQKK